MGQREHIYRKEIMNWLYVLKGYKIGLNKRRQYADTWINQISGICTCIRDRKYVKNERQLLDISSKM